MFEWLIADRTKAVFDSLGLPFESPPTDGGRSATGKLYLPRD